MPEIIRGVVVPNTSACKSCKGRGWHTNASSNPMWLTCEACETKVLEVTRSLMDLANFEISTIPQYTDMFGWVAFEYRFKHKFGQNGKASCFLENYTAGDVFICRATPDELQSLEESEIHFLMEKLAECSSQENHKP